MSLGLVGLHILRKTPDQGFMWSTLEQIDNTTKSFFNPDCADCTPNQKLSATAPYPELNPDGTPINPPVQVVRDTPIEKTDSFVPQLNAYYQGLLAGSVWANYQLVSTRWSTGGAPGGTPPLLANTVQETFIQPTSSCIRCHGFAKIATKASADVSFVFLLAK